MKGITFTTPGRLSVAMSLIFGLATIAAAPTAKAVTFDQVDIENGCVDVNETAGSGCDAADDATGFVLWCNDAAPVPVNIINGGVDVTQGGAVNAADDLFNCDLNDENGLIPSTNQVDIVNGVVDVDEDGVLFEATDDALDVNMFDTP